MDNSVDNPLVAVSVIELDQPRETSSKKTSRASAVDQHVSGRIRMRRLELGLTQQQIAGMINVTYQQAHKYEHGTNRISVGRLLQLADALAVPVSWFFEGLGETAQPEESPSQQTFRSIVQNFAAIENEKHQDALSQMARALAAQSLARRAGAG